MLRVCKKQCKKHEKGSLGVVDFNPEGKAFDLGLRRGMRLEQGKDFRPRQGQELQPWQRQEQELHREMRARQAQVWGGDWSGLVGVGVKDRSDGAAT